MARTPLGKTLKHLFQLVAIGEKNKLTPGQLVEMRAEALMSRRTAMVRTLEMAALVPVASMAWKEAMAAEMAKSFASRYGRRGPASIDGPAIIVGAGTAGLTAAYRLRQHNVDCVIYEGSDRTGGRMFTQSNFNQDGMFCERGGELVDSDHEELMWLCEEVGLPIQSLAETDSTLNLELYYINGKAYKIQDLLTSFKPMAKQVSSDLEIIFGKNSADNIVFDNSFNSSNFDKKSAEDYLSSLNGVDQWVKDLVKICYTGEYGREASDQSSLNIICQIGTKPKQKHAAGRTFSAFELLGESDESKRIQGGNQSLPRALEAQLTTAGVQIKKDRMLTKITDNGSQFTLTFNGNETVTASQVIIAIPFTLLRMVDGIENLSLQQGQLDCIKKLGYGTNAKMMTGYKSRLWRNLDDLKSNGLVYSNTFGQEFWETSRGQTGDSGIITSFMGGDTGKNIKPGDYTKTVDALNQVFPGVKDQYDGKALLQHWPTWKYTKGSYSCPLVGQYTSIIGWAGRPALDSRLCFAGEHTSTEWGGFMNGAVSSGNRVANDVLKSRKLPEFVPSKPVTQHRKKTA